MLPGCGEYPRMPTRHVSMSDQQQGELSGFKGGCVLCGAFSTTGIV